MKLRTSYLCFLASLLASCRVCADEVPGDWARWMRITFPGYTGSTTLTNFPALVRFNAANGFYDGFRSTNGYDLRFTDAAGNRLNHEVERWTAGGDSAVWVQVPLLTNGAAIWACWGHAADAGAPAAFTTNGATWTEGYLGVWHLDHLTGAGQHPDSTAAARHGTNVSTVATAGNVAGARSFSTASVNTPLNIDQDSPASGPITFSAWARPANTAGGTHHVLSSDNGGYDWALVQGGANWYVAWGGDYWNTGVPVDVGAWQHVAAVFIPGTGVRFYKNGAEWTYASIAFDTFDANVAIGRSFANSMENFAGAIDEARVSGVERSADWFQASYSNQVAGSTFVALGMPMPGQGVVNLPATDVTADSATLNGAVSATADPLYVSVYWSTNDGGTNLASWLAAPGHSADLGGYSNVTGEPVSQVVSGLESDAYCYYAFRATNAAGTVDSWGQPSLRFTPLGAPAVNNAAGAAGGAEEVTLRGELSAGYRADISVYWGRTDGGMTTNWEHVVLLADMPSGAFQALINPALGFDYRYRCFASNAHGTGWAPASGVFSTLWPHRVKITFSGYNRGEALTNFPALVVLNEGLPGFGYSEFVSPYGYDLRFTDAAGSTLNYEIEKWAPGADSYVWVQVPRFTNSCQILAHWGNPYAIDPQPYTANGATWTGAGYAGVWHMNETSGHHRDATAHGFDTTVETVTQRGTAPGKIDGADEFDGNDTEVQVPALGVYTNTVTISAWVNGKQNSDYTGIFFQRDSGGTTRAGIASLYHNLIYRWNDIQGGGTLAIPQDQWAFVALALTPADATLYVNDSSAVDASHTNANEEFNGTTYIGRWLWSQDSLRRWDGIIDEVRIATVTHSPNWLWATWLNQASNAVFNTVAPAVMIDNANGASDITTNSATLNGRLHWTNGVPTEVFVCWGMADAGTNAAAWEHVAYLGKPAVGPLATNITLSAAARYYYRFYASNTVSTTWADPAASFDSWPVTIRATAPTTFTVSRPAGATGANLVVRYTLGGGAINGVDYVELPGLVTIPAGATNAVITVVPIENPGSFAIFRTVIATLAPGDHSGYMVGAPNAAMLDIGPRAMLGPNRMRIVFTGYDGETVLTNFPALVVFGKTSLSNFQYSTFASPSGGDLRFADAEQSRWLSYEIDQWDAGGTSRVWVRVPELAGSSTTIWAFWGNPAATTPPAYTTNGATWSANYQAVLHFAENSGTISRDSSPNQFTGNLVGAPGPYWEAGKIGTALHFDGSDDRFDTGKNAYDFGMSGNNPKTSEAWVKVDGALADDGSVFSMGNASIGNEWTLNRMGSSPGWTSQHWTNDVKVGDAGNPDPIADWVHVAHTYDPTQAGGQTVKFYINGQQAGIGGPASLNVNTLNPVVLGCWYSRSWLRTYYDGYIDEARLANVTRSADWLRASWMSQSAPTTFAAYTYEASSALTGTLLIVR